MFIGGARIRVDGDDVMMFKIDIITTFFFLIVLVIVNTVVIFDSMDDQMDEVCQDKGYDYYQMMSKNCVSVENDTITKSYIAYECEPEFLRFKATCRKVEIE